MKAIFLRLILQSIMAIVCLPFAFSSTIDLDSASNLAHLVPDTLIVEITIDGTLCEGDSTSLHVDDIYDEVNWTGPGIMSKSDSVLIFINTGGQYIVTVSDTIDGEYFEAKDTVQIVQSFVNGGIYVPGEDLVFCAGDQVTLIAYGGGNLATPYEWIAPLNIKNDTFLIELDTTTSFDVVVNNSLSCSETYSVEIEISEYPDTTLQVSTYETCEGELISLSVATGNSYQWSNGRKNSSFSTIASLDMEPYEITITNASGCFIELVSDAFKIKKKSSFNVESNASNVQPGSSLSFSIEDLETDINCPADSFIWTINNMVVDGVNMNNTITFPPGLEGQIVNVCAQVVDTCGCSALKNCTEIDVRSGASCSGEISVSSLEVCVNDLVEFTGNSNSGSGGSNIFDFTEWSVNGIVISSTGEKNGYEVIEVEHDEEDRSGNMEIIFSEPGNYTITWLFDYDNNGTGCIREREVKIRVNDLPNITFGSFPDNVCKGDDLVVPILSFPTSPFDYTLTYLIGSQNVLDINLNSSKSLVIPNVNDPINFEFVSLVDNINGCATEGLQEQLDFSTEIYEPVTATLEDTCYVDGSYSSILMVSEGSGNFTMTGNGVQMGKKFTTVTIPKGDNTFIIVEDNVCPQFSFAEPISVQCECEERASILRPNTYFQCESSPIKIKIDSVAKIPNPDLNVLYYKVFDKNSGDLVNTVRYMDGKDSLQIDYDSAYEFGKIYEIQTIISNLSDNGEIFESYTCKDSSNIGAQIVFYANPIPGILGPDTVCLNQQDVIFEAIKDQFGNAIDWGKNPNDGIDIVTLSEVHIGAKFSKSGLAHINLRETFKPGASNNLVCYGTDEKEIFVTDEESLEKVNVNLFPGNILICEASESYCFQWYRIDKVTGQIIEGTKDKSWIIPSLNTDKYVYYCDVRVCGSDCVTSNFFNSLTPIIIGIEELEQAKFEVYPVPANQYLILKSNQPMDKQIVKLYSVLGQEISIQVEGISQQEVKISWQEIKAGIYYLTYFDSNAQKWVRPISIQPDF